MIRLAQRRTTLSAMGVLLAALGFVATLAGIAGFSANPITLGLLVLTIVASALVYMVFRDHARTLRLLKGTTESTQILRFGFEQSMRLAVLDPPGALVQRNGDWLKQFLPVAIYESPPEDPAALQALDWADAFGDDDLSRDLTPEERGQIERWLRQRPGFQWLDGILVAWSILILGRFIASPERRTSLLVASAIAVFGVTVLAMRLIRHQTLRRRVAECLENGRVAIRLERNEEGVVVTRMEYLLPHGIAWSHDGRVLLTQPRSKTR